jgi:hypothetical protein
MCLGLMLSLLAGTAVAQVSPGAGTWMIGGYAGLYQPDPSILDDSGTGGVRLGRLMSDRLALVGSLGITKPDVDDSRLDGDLDVTLLDVNATYLFGGSGWFGFALTGGIGYAWIDANIKDSIDPDFGVCRGNRCDVDDSFTVNVGIGPVFKVGKVNIRILNRWRYFDERDDDEIDSELTIGVLVPLGGS